MNLSNYRLNTQQKSEDRSFNYQNYFRGIKPDKKKQNVRKTSSKQIINSMINQQTADFNFSMFRKSRSGLDLDQKREQRAVNNKGQKINQNSSKKQLLNSKTNKKSIKQQKLGTNQKKHISTKKKHSKSVFNYYDDDKDASHKKQQKQFLKHNKSTVGHHNKSSCSHYNKSKNTHQTSISSVTKRKKSISNVGNKNMLSNSTIQQKINHFKVISSCLKTFLEDQLQHDNEINPALIIKMIKAFNKSEISKMSKSLQKLISDIILLIQVSIKKKKQSKNHLKNTNQSKQIKSTIFAYQTPQNQIRNKKIQSHSKNHTLNEFQIDSEQKRQMQERYYNYPQQDLHNMRSHDIAKTKKLYIDTKTSPSKQRTKQNIREGYQQINIQQLQKSLQQLHFESEQLKNFVAKHSNESFLKKQEENKEDQISYLRQILQEQKQIIKKIKE